MGREREGGQPREKLGVTSRTSERAVDVQLAGGVGTCPTGRSLCSSWSKGTAPAHRGSQTRGEWALKQEVQNPGQGHGADCGDRPEQRCRAGSRWLRWEQGRQEMKQVGHWAGTQVGRTGDSWST